MQPRTQSLKEKKPERILAVSYHLNDWSRLYQVTDKPFIKTGPRYRQQSLKIFFCSFSSSFKKKREDSRPPERVSNSECSPRACDIWYSSTKELTTTIKSYIIYLSAIESGTAEKPI